MKTRIKNRRKTFYDEEFNRITGKFFLSSGYFKEQTYRCKVEYFIIPEKRGIKIWQNEKDKKKTKIYYICD